MTQSADQKYTLAFTGDVMLGRGVNEMMLSRGTTYPLGDVVPLLKEPDLTLINLECVISKRGSEWMNPPHAFYFRADPLAIEILRDAGIDYVTLANNHVLDYGYDALEDTFQILEKADIQWAGAGRNLKQAKEPAWLKTGNLTLAVLAATDNFPEYAASQSHSGTWYFEIPPPETFFEELKKKITKLRNEGADLIVYSTHWGPNMVKVPPQHFQEFAHRLIDLGVDIFHGHSAHVFQGIEIYKGKIIFYATVIFAEDLESNGTKLTIELAKKHNKSIVINPTIEKLKEFAKDKKILNIAGNRESVSPGIQAKVAKIIKTAFG